MPKVCNLLILVAPATGVAGVKGSQHFYKYAINSNIYNLIKTLLR